MVHRIHLGAEDNNEVNGTYGWVSNTMTGRAPLSIPVEASWLDMSKERTDFNKVVAVYVVVGGANLGDN